MRRTTDWTRLYPFEDHYLDLDGLRYHYVDEGEGHPVLMVHGNPTWSFYYRDLIQQLRPGYRTIAPDHIGCGRSDKPGADRYPYTLSRRIDDLGRLVDALQLDQVTLVVHDWGGMIGTAWAARNPERVAGMVVLNTAAFHLPGGKSFPPTLALARTPGLGPFLVRAFGAFSRGANRFCVTRRPMSPEVAAGYLAPYDSWRNRVAVYKFVEDIPLKPSDPSYRAVSETAEALDGLREVPMLIAWGMRDFVFDHHFLVEWERRFPNAEVHRFEDAGHYILEDAGAEIGHLVEQFLARRDRVAEGSDP
ncbi:MAG: alpha/beta fold hydrolase [Myxococcota bacterium]